KKSHDSSPTRCRPATKEESRGARRADHAPGRYCWAATISPSLATRQRSVGRFHQEMPNGTRSPTRPAQIFWAVRNGRVGLVGWTGISLQPEAPASGSGSYSFCRRATHDLQSVAVLVRHIFLEEDLALGAAR